METKNDHLLDAFVEISPLDTLFLDPEFIEIGAKNPVPIIFEKNQMLRNNSVQSEKISILENVELQQSLPDEIIEIFKELSEKKNLGVFPLSIQIVAQILKSKSLNYR